MRNEYPVGVAVRGRMTVRKFREDQNPATDEPDEIVTVNQWIEGGQLVTDPQRIAELDAQVKGDDNER